MLSSIYDKPMAMTALWMEALRLLGRQWLRLASIFLVFFGVLLGGWFIVLDYMVSAAAHTRAAHHGASAAPQAHHAVHFANAAVSGALPLFVLMVVFTVCAFVLVGRCAVDVCYCDLNKQKVNLWQSFVYVLRRFHWLILYAVVQLVLVALGLVCLIIPGIALAMMLPFGYFFILYDQASPIEACKRAVALVWGNWWRTFIVLLVPGVLLNICIRILMGVSDIGTVSMHSVQPGGLAASSLLVFIIMFIADVLYFGFVYCLLNCLFQDLLKRKALSQASS